jgi:WD40 repeat protein
VAQPTKSSRSLRDELQEWRRFIRADTHILREYPRLVFQQAMNQLDISAIAVAARKRWESGIEQRSWLQWVNKPQRLDPCLLTMAGHRGMVRACAYSPDGRRILSGAADGTLKVWDAETGIEIATLGGHAGQVTACQYSSDGKRILSASFDKTIKIWDAESGVELITLAGHEDKIGTCSYTPDAKRIVSVSFDDKLNVWDTATGAKVATLPAHWTGNTWGYAISPDSRHIVSAVEDSREQRLATESGSYTPYYSLKVWDLESGNEIATLIDHEAGISGRVCAYSPDGARLAVGGSDLKVWDTHIWQEVAAAEGHKYWDPIHKEHATTAIDSCAYTNDGAYVITVSERNFLPHLTLKDGKLINKGTIKLFPTLRVWHADTCTQVAILEGHKEDIESYANSPDGKRIVTASADKTLKLWDIDLKIQMATLIGHQDLVSACVYSPDGTRIVSASYDGTLKLWDANANTSAAAILDRKVTACAFSPDGKRIAFVSKQGAVKLFATRVGAEPVAYGGETLKYFKEGEAAPEQAKQTVFEDAVSVESCAYSPDSRLIATGSSGMSLKVLDASLGTVIAELAGHPGPIWACAYSPDGGSLVSGDSKAIIWNTQTWAKVCELGGFKNWLAGCVYSPDGRQVVVASADALLFILDLGSLSVAGLVTGHTKLVQACASSPDGRYVVTASSDATLKVWDIGRRQEVATLNGHADKVDSCSFSPDGRRLVSASGDATLKLWNTVTWTEVATFSGHRVPATDDRVLEIWDVNKGLLIATPSGYKDKLLCAYSPDCRHVISGTSDGVVKVWDVNHAIEAAQFVTGSCVTAIAVGDAGRHIGVGTESGWAYVLRLQTHLPTVPVVTASYLYRFSRRRRDKRPSYQCAWCGLRLRLPSRIARAIRELNSDTDSQNRERQGLLDRLVYRRSRAKVSFAALPVEAWDNPRLLSECAHCNQRLRFNPFIVDNRDRY